MDAVERAAEIGYRHGEATAKWVIEADDPLTATIEIAQAHVDPATGSFGLRHVIRDVCEQVGVSPDGDSYLEIEDAFVSAWNKAIEDAKEKWRGRAHDTD